MNEYLLQTVLDTKLKWVLVYDIIGDLTFI